MIRAGKYKVEYITPEQLFPRGQAVNLWSNANTVSNKAEDAMDDVLTQAGMYVFTCRANLSWYNENSASHELQGRYLAD